MDSYDAYKLYLGMKAHFEKGNYDFIQYGGKTKSTKESFFKKRSLKISLEISSKDLVDLSICKFCSIT